MNSFSRMITTTIFLIVFRVGEAGAQFMPSKWEIGINAGTLVYQGDLAASRIGYTGNLKPAVQVWVSKSLTDYFSLRANLLRGGINADESTYTTPEWRSHRNLAFSSSVTEASVVFVWDLNGKTYREGMRRFSPYLFAGAGFSLLHIQRNWSRFDTTYFNSNTTASIGLGYDSLQKSPGFLPVIPVGIGFRYMISNQFFINLEGTYRITASDYIDGFKFSGNPNLNDHYYGVSLGISYRFGKSDMSCPKTPL